MSKEASLGDIFMAALKIIANQGLTNDEELNKKLDDFVDNVKANSIEPLVLVGQHGLSEMNIKSTTAVELLTKTIDMEIDDTGDDHNRLAFESVLALSPHLSKPIAKEIQNVLRKYIKNQEYVEPEMGDQDD